MSSEEAAQLLIIREGPHRSRHEALVSLIEQQWGGKTCGMRECDSCGFGFADPFVAGNSEFYNLAYPTIAYPRAKWEYERTVEALRQLPTRGATAIDIAAGHGFFLDLCVPEFFDARNVAATEFNLESAARLEEKGYRVRTADIRSDAFNDLNGRLDFVFMFQVLEHLDDIDHLFARLSELTSPLANIFIAVPNVRWIRYREETGSLKDLPPIHIGRWTRAAFSAIAGRHGLTVAAAEIEPFAVVNFVAEDLLFSHFARAHRTGSVANRARSIRSNNARQIAEALEAVLMAPRRAGAFARGFRHRNDMGGGAFWVHLTKPT